MLEAARTGLGVALLPTHVARDALAAGHIVKLIPQYAPHETWFKTYVPRRNLNVPRVRALIDRLGE